MEAPTEILRHRVAALHRAGIAIHAINIEIRKGSTDNTMSTLFRDQRAKICARIGITTETFLAQRPLAGVSLHGSDGPFTPSRAAGAPAADDTNVDEPTTGDAIADSFDRMAEEHEKAGRSEDASLCRRIAAEHREKAESARRKVHKDDATAANSLTALERTVASNLGLNPKAFAAQKRASVVFSGR
jgi:hypothetical protein